MHEKVLTYSLTRVSTTSWRGLRLLALTEGWLATVPDLNVMPAGVSGRSKSLPVYPLAEAGGEAGVGASLATTSAAGAQTPRVARAVRTNAWMMVVFMANVMVNEGLICQMVKTCNWLKEVDSEWAYLLLWMGFGNFSGKNRLFWRSDRLG